MKKLLILAVISIFFLPAFSQTSYYEGEWTETGTTTYFKGFMKLEVYGNKINGEIIWTFIFPDRSNPGSVDFYRGKEGLIGIEHISGTINLDSYDVLFEGYKEDDPNNVIGTDKYYAKFSKQLGVIYGKTWSNGDNNGLFYMAGVNEIYGRLKEKELKDIKTGQVK